MEPNYPRIILYFAPKTDLQEIKVEKNTFGTRRYYFTPTDEEVELYHKFKKNGHQPTINAVLPCTRQDIESIKNGLVYANNQLYKKSDFLQRCYYQPHFLSEVNAIIWYNQIVEDKLLDLIKTHFSGILELEEISTSAGRRMVTRGYQRMLNEQLLAPIPYQIAVNPAAGEEYLSENSWKNQ